MIQNNRDLIPSFPSLLTGSKDPEVSIHRSSRIIIVVPLNFRQTRIEERLDDAINVLRNHAEGAILHNLPGATSNQGLTGPGPSLPVHSRVPHSNGLLCNTMGASYQPNAAMSPIDAHMVWIYNLLSIQWQIPLYLYIFPY